MAGLSEHTAIRTVDDQQLATLDKAWEIWGPNGGYIASICLRAAGMAAPDGHRPLSLKCQYLNAGRFEDAVAIMDIADPAPAAGTGEGAR